MGHVREASTPRQGLTQRHRDRAPRSCLLLSVVAVAALFLACNGPSPETPLAEEPAQPVGPPSAHQAPSVPDGGLKAGDIVYLGWPDSQGPPVANDFPAMQELLKVAASKDTFGSLGLMRQGRLFFVENNTSALLVEVGESACEVRIRDGIHAGGRGYVLTSSVRLTPVPRPPLPEFRIPSPGNDH